MYRRKDSFHARAKAEGYRSRAAYKLLELAKTHGLIRKGDVVVDLGAWPGGWLQVAAELCGPRGRVVGIDQRPIEPLGLSNVWTLAGDVADPLVLEQAATACGRPADVLLSDLAPSLSGIRARDEAQADALLDCVLTWAGARLRPGGHVLVKMFMGSDFASRRERLRAAFTTVRTTKPEATRKGSAEVYAVASGFLPRERDATASDVAL